MGFRIKNHTSQLFQLYAEVVGPVDGKDGWILHKYPDEFVDEGILKTVPLFCFPSGVCSTGAVQQFSFVLTDVKGNFTFGFCRSNTDGNTCLCVLSYMPWHDLFYKLLNYIGDLMKKNTGDELLGFLRAAHRADVPQGGDILHIIYKFQKIEFQSTVPDNKKLPSIPENRAVTEYFNAMDLSNMTTIFASLLNERRIIITSKKLGRLSACVMACEILLFPLHWQHIFVTVLPKKLLEHVTAPMPFVIGVPGDLMPLVLRMDLGEVVIVDADANTVSTPFDDTRDIPSNVVSIMKTAAGKMFGDGVARAFMRALVMLIGGYRFGLRMPPGEKISFDMDKFIRSRPANLQMFLSNLSELQIFRQFIEERLDILNGGEGFSDEFEAEVSLLIDHESDNVRDMSIADQYRRWTSKGESLLRTVTTRIKDRGKDTVKGLRDRMNDFSVRDLGAADRPYGSNHNDAAQAGSSLQFSDWVLTDAVADLPETAPGKTSKGERAFLGLSGSTDVSSGSSNSIDRNFEEAAVHVKDNEHRLRQQTVEAQNEAPLINLDADSNSSQEFFDFLTATDNLPPLPVVSPTPPSIPIHTHNYSTTTNHHRPLARNSTLPAQWASTRFSQPPMAPVYRIQPRPTLGVQRVPENSQWYTDVPVPAPNIVLTNNTAQAKDTTRPTNKWESFE